MPRFPQEIDRYMSSVLVTVEPSWPLIEALRLMKEHEIRHLPVVTRGRVAGLVSRASAERILEQASGRPPLIRDALEDRTWIVDPEEPAARVARGMAKRRADCAIVAHGDRLMGLFTTTDALLALAALIDDEHVPGPEVAEAATPRTRGTTRRARVPAKSGAKPVARPRAARKKALRKTAR